MMRREKVSKDSYSVEEYGDFRKLSFKHQSLIQDFDELQRETLMMKMKLQRAKLKKSNLLAEVRFLRRRYKYLLKTQSHKNQSDNLTRHHNPEIQTDNAILGKLFREKEAAMPSPSTVLDLNQISDPKGDHAEEFQVAWEPLRMEKKLKKCSMEGDPLMNDLKLSICRDVGKGSNRAGKRKISWQDPGSSPSVKRKKNLKLHEYSLFHSKFIIIIFLVIFLESSICIRDLMFSYTQFIKKIKIKKIKIKKIKIQIR